MEQTIEQSGVGSRRRLRIGMLGSRGYPHTYSGYEVFIRELAPRLVSRGHEVIVYCRRGLFKERPKYYNGVQLVYVPNIDQGTWHVVTHVTLHV